MTEIASAAMPQLGSLLPLVVRPRRWRSPKHPPAASPEQGRSQKYHPIASREHLGYALSLQIVSDGPSDHSSTDAGDAQIPIAHRSG
jgi:hypothetical protein